LPDSSTLGSPRGYRVARVITHDHSPYSYDACDKAGLQNGVPHAECLKHLKDAICRNRVDLLFLSDHPSEMEKYEMEALLLKQEGDELLAGSDGVPYANRVGSCENGFKPMLMTGFEDRLLSLGMLRHAAATIAERETLYREETFAARSRLATDSDAVVMIPHTESRSLETLQTLAPDAIEIYNIHANLDPKIRKRDLGLKPFDHMPRILTYLVDPYKSLDADYMFMQFVFMHPDYFEKWDRLIEGGLKVAGFGGSDSHENIFKQTASDGERLDSHRRLTRFMSNHLLVHSTDPASVKAALKSGRGWLVFEGLGSPADMDFAVSAGGQTVGVGETVALGGGPATIRISHPTLHPGSPKGEESPTIRVELRKVVAGGKDDRVAQAVDGDLTYETSEAGAYRAEIWIIPRHLREKLGDFSNLADDEYRWIVTNHVYLAP
jgi:hypothetical protein